MRSIDVKAPARDFGYTVGDVLAIDTTILVAKGTLLDRRTLPVPGPLNAAIDLRDIDVTETTGRDATVVRIHAAYQCFLAPDHVTETEIPKLSLQLIHGTIREAAEIPAWSFHVSPLREATHAVEDSPGLRPNHVIEPAPDHGLVFRLAGSLFVALLALAAFLQGRGWVPALRQSKHPFQIAARSVRALVEAGEDDAAYRALHRAFDATAGRQVLARDAGDFLKTHEKYAVLRDDIINFYTASEGRFFGRPGTACGVAPHLVRLAKSLSRLERRG